MAPGPVDAAGTVDAQTAPTAPWKTPRVFHELPQGLLSTKSSTDRLNHPQILLRNLEKERAKEDEWFARNEKEMLEKARVARDQREHERAERVALDERQRVKQLHFMKCPKCGHDLAERDLEGVTVDQCSFCEGVFLDAGELDALFLKHDSERKGVLRKLLRF